jgi:hypothetical protein
MGGLGSGFIHSSIIQVFYSSCEKLMLRCLARAARFRNQSLRRWLVRRCWKDGSDEDPAANISTRTLGAGNEPGREGGSSVLAFYIVKRLFLGYRLQAEDDA